MLSGGSSVSWSVTWLAITVTVHNSLYAKSVSGSNVKLVGPPLTAAGWLPLVAHKNVNQLPVTSTVSLKLIVILAAMATPIAPFDGVVLATAGAMSWLFRGLGAPTTKSVGLLSVSVAPFPSRSTASVLLGAGAGPLPSKQFALVP